MWLLGKTGAGKTAIVAALTGDPRAEVGQGFEPCTRTAGFYDVPPEAPLLRFLDTRGLGEASYDPASDIAWCEEQSHLVLVVMQVSDPVQHVVLQALQQARRRHPEWPVVVAQTGLHRLYPAGMGHPIPIPIRAARKTRRSRACRTPLRQALAHQRKLFDGLRGPRPRFVPIDFTAAGGRISAARLRARNVVARPGGGRARRVRGAAPRARRGGERPDPRARPVR